MDDKLDLGQAPGYDSVIPDQTPSGLPQPPADRKEELARQIAKNMAAAGDDPPSGVVDFSGYEGRTTGTREMPRQRTAPQKQQTAKKKTARKKKRRKAAARTAAIATGVCLLVIGGAGALFYLAGLNTYKGVFLDNTYINGINVSGMTEGEAYAAISGSSTLPEKVVISRKSGGEVKIDLTDIGYKDNSKAFITEFFKGQDHYGWLRAKFNDSKYFIDSSFECDTEKLEGILKHKFSGDTGSDPENAYIKREGTDSFVIVPETGGDRIDTDKLGTLYSYVEERIADGEYTMDVSGLDLYKEAEIKAADLEEDCDRLNGLKNIEISFDFNYTTETLYGDRIIDWIEFDEDNLVDVYTVDRDRVEAYVEELAEKYDTYNKDRTFQTTNRGEIVIPQGQGCYGWWLDQKEMINEIVSLIEKGESVEDEPIYYVNPNSGYTYMCDPEVRTAEKDWGDTYFEVDLTAQHLWYYENGKVEMETDIVSGYPNESRNTPGGVYKLWLKERGKTLTGSSDGHSYSSYVEYWNNISTISIGFHDASWQNGVFGGEKYKSSTWGSHGCINMPFNAAKYIYENCDYGTPVFAYWS